MDKPNDNRHDRLERGITVVAAGGALQVEAGRALAVAVEIAFNVVVEGEASRPRQRAPPTCTKCGTQGHNRALCRQTESRVLLLYVLVSLLRGCPVIVR